MSSNAGPILAVVIIALVSVIGVAVLAPVITQVSNAGVGQGSATFEPTPDEPALIDASLGEGDASVNVRATREYGVYLDSTGHVDASAPSGWDSNSWTACVVAEPATGSDGGLFSDGEDTGWNENATYDALAMENGTLLIQWDAGKWRSTYRPGNDSATVTVNATADRTPICTSYNQTSDELTLYAGGQSSSAALDSNPAVTNVSQSWLGMLDEVRLIEGEAPQSEISAYQDDPIRPLDVNHTARWMLDEGEGSTSTGYYDAGTATLVGASWVSGVPGPGLERGVDYQLSFEPFTVTALSGGYLEGAPVAFVSWMGPLAAAFNSLTAGLDSSFSFIPIIMLVLLASLTVAAISRLQ